jgi:hypothetical protein
MPLMTRSEELAMHNRLRLAQAKRVMPVVGPLLDAWDGIANDVRSGLEEDAPTLVAFLDRLRQVVEAD